ncbi:MAG: DUF6139 family protein [Pseudomonadota bacterium]
MRVDMYRRPEADARVSFLAVPEGRPIPEEVINTDWTSEGGALDVDEEGAALREFGITDATQQISEKGYAITSLENQQSEAG